MTTLLYCLFSLSQDDIDTDKELLTPVNKRHEENRRTRDKMKSVRSQMEKCSLVKEQRDQVTCCYNQLFFMITY